MSKTVEIKVTTPDGKDNSAVGVYLETKRGDTWTRQDGKDIVANKDVEKVQIKAGQRLVIDPFVTPEMVYDRAQGAAIDPSKQKNPDGKADEPARNTEANKQEQDRLKAQFNRDNPGGTVPEANAPRGPNPEPKDTKASMAQAGGANTSPTKPSAPPKGAD